MTDQAPAKFTETIRSLNASGARVLIEAAETAAVTLGSKIVVAVTDRYGFLLGLLRMDGAPLCSIALAEAKARTAALVQLPTDSLQAAVDNGKASYISANELTPIAGGIPIIMDSIVVGAIGVSGAPEGGDCFIAKSGADALLFRQAL